MLRHSTASYGSSSSASITLKWKVLVEYEEKSFLGIVERKWYGSTPDDRLIKQTLQSVFPLYHLVETGAEDAKCALCFTSKGKTLAF